MPRERGALERCTKADCVTQDSSQESTDIPMKEITVNTNLVIERLWNGTPNGPHDSCVSFKQSTIHSADRIQRVVKPAVEGREKLHLPESSGYPTGLNSNPTNWRRTYAQAIWVASARRANKEPNAAPDPVSPFLFPLQIQKYLNAPGSPLPPNKSNTLKASVDDSVSSTVRQV